MKEVVDHKPLLTHEVGSLDKPGWRVKAYAGKPLDDKDLEEARSWGERLQVPGYERLLDLFRHAPFGKGQKAELQRWASLYSVRLEESAGRDFVLEVARNLIRPNLEALLTLGARWIQVDEPGASTEADELDLFVDSFNASVEGLNAMFSTHLCFSDYNLFFPAIERMEHCRQFAVGFANYDSRELGTSEQARPGYQVIKKFRDLPYKPALGLGVLDIHSDFIESPELVRDRVLYAVKVFGDPKRIHVTPDCGLRTRSWQVAYEKLKNMTAGVELARKELGL